MLFTVYSRKLFYHALYNNTYITVEYLTMTTFISLSSTPQTKIQEPYNQHYIKLCMTEEVKILPLRHCLHKELKEEIKAGWSQGAGVILSCFSILTININKLIRKHNTSHVTFGAWPNHHLLNSTSALQYYYCGVNAPTSCCHLKLFLHTASYNYSKDTQQIFDPCLCLVDTVFTEKT